MTDTTLTARIMLRDLDALAKRITVLENEVAFIRRVIVAQASHRGEKREQQARARGRHDIGAIEHNI